MTPIRCFVLNPTPFERVWLRRYCSPSECSVHPHKYHGAMTPFHDRIFETAAKEEEERMMVGLSRAHDDHKHLWPTQCQCGYTFTDDDNWQYFNKDLYAVDGTDILYTMDDAPPGALFRVTHLEEYDHWTSPYDHQCWQVKLPNGNWWQIDSRASNCDSPCKHCRQPYHNHNKERCSNPGSVGSDGQILAYTVGSYQDSRPEHRCWCRSGKAPNFHVDKNGVTCGAGGGSILSGGWHGFLHNGHLTSC